LTFISSDVLTFSGLEFHVSKVGFVFGSLGVVSFSGLEFHVSKVGFVFIVWEWPSLQDNVVRVI